MEKQSILDELSVLAQFFPSEEKVEWKRWETGFSAEIDVLYVYGFSPYIEPLLEWLKGDIKRELVFLEDRMEVIRQIEGEILEGPQVHFKFCLGDVEEFIGEVVQGFPFEKIDAVCLHDNQERFAEIRKLLFRKTTLEEAVHSEMIHYHKLAKNLLPNFKRLNSAFDVGAWKDQFKGVPAIVCGAGPSLEMVQEELKGMEEKALIFAGGSTITALTNLGIKPHLLYAIDPNREEFTRLCFHTAYDVPLVFGCRVEPNIFYAHAGPIGYLSTGTGGRLEKWLEGELGIQDRAVLKGLGEEALSVTTIAFMSALYFGCNPIILAGVDLAYDQGRRYAGGVEFENVVSKKVGDLVLEEEGITTMTKWLMERDVLDDVCKLYPDRKFIKATSKGLPFKNIPFDPDWHKLTETFDLRGKIHDLVMQAPLNVNLEGQLLKFFESLKRCKTLIEKLLIATTTTLLELDLEDEIAFQIALKPAFYALTFHVRRKKRGASDDDIQKELYRHLQAIIEQYLILC